jgi:hypothetical protein
VSLDRKRTFKAGSLGEATDDGGGGRDADCDDGDDCDDGGGIESCIDVSVAAVVAVVKEEDIVYYIFFQ